MQLEYHSQPTPHAFVPQLVAPDVYARIRFPEIPPRPGGRIGRDSYFGEPEWERVMATPGWSELSSTFMSESFMRNVITLFADDIVRLGCGIDPNKVYLTPKAEDRDEMAMHTLSESDDPNNLFIRFDLQASDDTYEKPAHCDYPRRVVGGVLFMTSAEDEGLDGGDFAFHSDLAFTNDRLCHQPRVEKVFPVRHNQGIVFLNSNSAFHGPTPIRRMSGMRKWIYYSISSRCDVWRAGF